MVSETTGRWDLTPSQRDVLNCVMRGLSNTIEIARELEIAEGAVKIHLAALFAQFGARNRAALAHRAQAVWA
jgi:DNA-binding NarL/FixJ family response regulator